MPSIYQTSPCPCCHSENTGLLLTNMTLEDKVRNMKKGVRVKSRDIAERNNLFCADCKHRFHGDIRTISVDEIEYNRILRERGIDRAKLQPVAPARKKHFTWLRNMLPDFSDFRDLGR